MLVSFHICLNSRRPRTKEKQKKKQKNSESRTQIVLDYFFENIFFLFEKNGRIVPNKNALKINKLQGY